VLHLRISHITGDLSSLRTTKSLYVALRVMQQQVTAQSLM